MTGECVEVWCPTTGRWVSGYRVNEWREDGTVLVSRPGGGPLPVPLSSEHVRLVAPVTQEWRRRQAQRGWGR